MTVVNKLYVGFGLARAYMQWLVTQCSRKLKRKKHTFGWSPEEEKFVTLAREGLRNASVDTYRSLNDWMVRSDPTKGLQLSCIPAATFQTPGFRDSWWISLNPEHQPEKPKASVTICFLHGGGFKAGLPLLYQAAYKIWLLQLADLGIHARLFAVGYPLAPENRYPLAVQGAAEAYQWLVQQEGGSDRIILAGDSAGGNLVFTSLLYMRSAAARASMASTKTSAGPTAAAFNPPLAAVAISPAPDLRLTAPSSNLPYTKYDILTPKTFTSVRKAYLQPGWTSESLSDPLLSPICCEDFSGLVRTEMLVLAGGSEMLAEDIKQLVQRVHGLGGLTVQYHLEEGLPHCYPVLGMKDWTRKGADVIVPFIAKVASTLGTGPGKV